MLGVERATKLIEKEVIEVAPLAYLRGRTLNNAFIIMDQPRARGRRPRRPTRRRPAADAP